MTQYEALSITVSCIAAFGTLYVWFGQRKLQREANDLQRATAELAKKQLELIALDQERRSKARLRLTLEQEGRDYYFLVTNIGEVPAQNVEVRLVLENPSDSPLIAEEYAEKFPVKRLPPGGSVSLIAALAFGSPSAYEAVLKWTNPDGSSAEEDAYVPV